jgi:hypothetical protein
MDIIPVPNIVNYNYRPRNIKRELHRQMLFGLREKD